jgi:hypothetical protein
LNTHVAISFPSNVALCPTIMVRLEIIRSTRIHTNIIKDHTKILFFQNPLREQDANVSNLLHARRAVDGKYNS